MTKQKRRARRFFTNEYKEKVAKAVVEHGVSPSVVAKNFDLGVHSVRAWVKAYKGKNRVVRNIKVDFKAIPAARKRITSIVATDPQGVLLSPNGRSLINLITWAEGVLDAPVRQAIDTTIHMCSEYSADQVRRAIDLAEQFNAPATTRTGTGG